MQALYAGCRFKQGSGWAQISRCDGNDNFYMIEERTSSTLMCSL
jgi:hypothetical protein